MVILNLIMRWVHLFSAATVIGSAMFLRLVLFPAVLELSDEARTRLLVNLAKPFRILVHSAIAGLLLSGLYNTHVLWKTTIHPYFLIYATKVSLAAAIFIIAILLTSSNPTWTAFQADRKKWLTVDLVLVAVLVALSAYLRTLHR